MEGLHTLVTLGFLNFVQPLSPTTPQIVRRVLRTVASCCMRTRKVVLPFLVHQDCQQHKRFHLQTLRPNVGVVYRVRAPRICIYIGTPSSGLQKQRTSTAQYPYGQIVIVIKMIVVKMAIITIRQLLTPRRPSCKR